MYERYDMNDTVRYAITAHAANLDFTQEVRGAIFTASNLAGQRDQSAARDANLLEQVCGLMNEETLRTEPVHIARGEIYASPQTVAYAFLATACETFLEDEPSHPDPEHNSPLESYEKSAPNHEADAYLLGIAVKLMEEELEA